MSEISSVASPEAKAVMRLTGLAILIALGFMALPAFAQNVTDDDVNAIAQRLYCPVCENTPLDVCPTAACGQWREEIRTQLEAGRTEEQIVADFVARFGERVIGTPQDPTLRAVSLVTPWLIGLVAVGIAGFTVIRWRRNRGQQAVYTAPGTGQALSDDDYRARIERDLLARR